MNPIDETAQSGVRFGSNELRLGVREWGITLAIVAVVLIAVPVIWKGMESFDPSDAYRIPFESSEDYWVYRRLGESARQGERILIIGDSVVWGEYVTPDQTLSQALNRRVDAGRFTNGGLSGAHLLALEGLVRHYLDCAPGDRVILHLNLLWLSSAERDLSSNTGKPVSFNHPDLLPQLSVSIPAYRAALSDRMGVVVDRHVPFRRWVHHLRARRFDHLDLHTWSIEHPYENPLRRISLDLPEPSSAPRHLPAGEAEPLPWSRTGITAQDLPWVRLSESLQWAAFLRALGGLRDRGCLPLVIVGPLNEHLLEAGSLAAFRSLTKEVDDRLRGLGIPYLMPAVLPSDEYGDASHPLHPGYQRLAAELVRDPVFMQWLKR